MGGIVLALIAIFVFRQDPSAVLGTLTGGGSSGGASRELTAAEKELGEFSATVLGYTEDVWDEIYPTLALAHPGAEPRYRHPRLVLFTDRVESACGAADAAIGPFYCPGDHQVYIDLTFFQDLATRFRAPGDFAQAYVIAHEVGHHVQSLLGISARVHREQQRLSQADANRLSVRLELQADYFAGVWAHRAEKRFAILERGDVEEALGAATAIGDDTLQRRGGRGTVVPDAFTHGTSEQRARWFRRGLESGDPRAHDPFRGRYEDL